MKTLVTNYTFSAAAKQITFTDYPSLKLDQILLITNVTDNIIIYNFADPTAGGTLAGNVLTLTYNTTTMSNTDRLQIFIDDYVVPSTEASLTAVRIRIDNTNTLLNVLTSRQDTINISASTINLNTDEVEGLIRTTNSNLTGTNLNITTFNRQLTGQVLTINQNVSATNPRLSSIDVKLTTLINQTDTLESSNNSIASSTNSIAGNTNVFNPYNISTYTTTALTSSLLVEEAFIFSIRGTSYAGYDQYLQIFDSPNANNIFSQIIKANENFYFEFPKGFYVESGTVRNSLTPISHTTGNNDLIMTISIWL